MTLGEAVGSTDGSVLGQDGKVLTRGDNDILGIVLEGTDDGSILELAVEGDDGGLVPLVGVAVGSTEGSIVGQDDVQDGKVLTRGDNNELGIVLEGTDDGSILAISEVGSDDGSMLGLNDGSMLGLIEVDIEDGYMVGMLEKFCVDTIP